MPASDIFGLTPEGRMAWLLGTGLPWALLWIYLYLLAGAVVLGLTDRLAMPLLSQRRSERLASDSFDGPGRWCLIAAWPLAAGFVWLKLAWDLAWGLVFALRLSHLFDLGGLAVALSTAGEKGEGRP